jgi:carbon-monoxide dehydrogenase large subunit
MVATLTAELLGVGPEDVRVEMGDTDMTPYGLGGWGSRSAGVMAGAIADAAGRVREKALRIAAHLLEAAPEDLVIEDGRFVVLGTDRSVSWSDVATVAIVRTLDLPPDVEPGLGTTATFDPPNIAHLPDESGRVNGVATYTNSSHAVVAKVDVETGRVDLLEYLVGHDCGRIINRNLVEGQIQGGVAQGIGGTLLETLPYAEDGQPLASSFMDYLLPTAMEIPPIQIRHFETPAPEMPLGVKGAGEAGIIGPAAAIASAVENALSREGVRLGSITSTPITPASLRRLIREARRERDPSASRHEIPGAA